jgi:hypothetical protein
MQDSSPFASLAAMQGHEALDAWIAAVEGNARVFGGGHAALSQALVKLGIQQKIASALQTAGGAEQMDEGWASEMPHLRCAV